MAAPWKLTLACALCACSDPVYVLRGAPAPSPAPRIDGHHAALSPPDTYDARIATSRDGWPLWIVRHEDGSISALSAVAAAPTSSAATVFAGRASLVRWLPATRRFLSGDVAYDERGHVLGYATNELCEDDCPRITVPAPDERDLDRFEAVLTAQQLLIGPLRESRVREGSGWMPYDHEQHVARELAAGPDEVLPAVPIAIADALARPVGSYAVVAGSIVQSTGVAPLLCADSPRCASCNPASPALLGVHGVPVSTPAATHVHSGTLLVRREPTGLAVIATSTAGACVPRDRRRPAHTQ